MKKTVLGVIGGSGLYELEGLTHVRENQIHTPFGLPSDTIVTGQLNGKPVAFLPRHGKGHRFTPSEVNYRANIYALKSVGVSHILAVSAVGSLKEELSPETIVIPDQLLDRTTMRQDKTFFGEGVVGHVGFAEPYCEEMRHLALQAVKKSEIQHSFGGTLVTVEGPRFSTKAESFWYRSMGCSVIGMTGVPEAILAREAEIPYCNLALVTDYDCWHEVEEAVDVSAVIAVLKKNVENSKEIVKCFLELIPEETENPIFEAAKLAIMTPPDLIPTETKRKLALFYGKYWE